MKLGAWLAVAGALLLAGGVLAQEQPWYERAGGIEARLFDSLSRGDPESFRALVVTGVASVDARAAVDSFGKVREWLASSKVDLSKTKLLRSSQSGIDLLSFRPGRAARVVWDLKGPRFFIGCPVSYAVDGDPSTARVAGPLRCWTPAQGVKVTAGKGETIGGHEIRRYSVEGQAAGEVGLVLRRSAGGEGRAGFPVQRGSWKLALSVVECPAKGSLAAPSPSYELSVAGKNGSSATLVDVPLPGYSECDVASSFTESLAGPDDFVPILRRAYFKVPEGAEAGAASLVFTVELGVEFRPE